MTIKPAEDRVMEFMLRMFLHTWKNPKESMVFLRVHKQWYATRTTEIARFASTFKPIPANLKELCPQIQDNTYDLYKHRIDIMPAPKAKEQEQLLEKLRVFLALFGVTGIYSGSMYSQFLRISIQSGRDVLGAIIIIPET